jgi:hypothetical protein
MYKKLSQILNKKPVIFSFQDKCQSNGERWQRIATRQDNEKHNMVNEVTKLFTSSLQQCAFNIYSWCSKWVPCVLRQMAVRHHNMRASAVVTAAWSLTMRSLILVGRTVYTCPFKCPHRKKSNRVSLGNLGGHAVGPSHPVHLPEYITPTTTGHFTCNVMWLCHAGIITPVTQLEAQLKAAPVEQFEEKQYCWASSQHHSR